MFEIKIGSSIVAVEDTTELQAYVDAGKATAETEIRKSGGAKWSKLRNVKGLSFPARESAGIRPVARQLPSAIERNWLRTLWAPLLGILVIVVCSIGAFSLWMTLPARLQTQTKTEATSNSPRDVTASNAVGESASQFDNDRRIEELQTVIGTLQMEIKQLNAKNEASSLFQNEMNEFKRKTEKIHDLMLNAQNQDSSLSQSVLDAMQAVEFRLDSTNNPKKGLLFSRTQHLEKAILTMLADLEGTRSLNERANAVLEIFNNMESEYQAHLKDNE